LTTVKERNLNDQQRYKKLYDIDVRDYKNYNLVVDTSERTPEEILAIILAEFKARRMKKGI
jgi:cytidylate kinase